MKLNTRMVSLLMSLLILLLPLGAQATSGTTAAVGGYIEQEIALPAGYAYSTGPAALPDGGFAVAAQQENSGEWALLSFASVGAEPAVTPLDTALGDILSIKIAPDGQVAAVVLARESQGERHVEDKETLAVVWYAADGSMATHFNDQNGYIENAVALSGRRFAVLYRRAGVKIYDDTGREVGAFPFNDIYQLAAGQDNLFFMQDGKVVQMDVSGNTLRTVPFPPARDMMSAVGSDGTLYMVDTTGIYWLDPQETEVCQVSNAARFMIGAPDSGLDGLCALKDGTLVARLSFNGNEPLLAYRYDPQLDLSNTAQFTVTALRDSEKLRKAVNEFQRAHPELNVRLHIQLDEGDKDSPVEDAIRVLNTDLLSGNGGDVLILDELPLRQYIEKGVLIPLDEVLADVGFLRGIQEACRAADGKLYAMPVQFVFDTLWGHKEQIAAVNSLTELVAMPLQPGQTLLSAFTPEILLRMFYPASSARFLDASGQPRFDTPGFDAFLESLYQIYSMQIGREIDREPSAKMSREDMQALLDGAIAFTLSRISTTMAVDMVYTFTGGEESGFIATPAIDGAGTTFTPNLLVGINAHTDQRELAEDFLRMLFSPPIQELDNGEGLPAVVASLDNLFAQVKEIGKNNQTRAMFALPSGGTMPISPLDETSWDAMRMLCDTLNQAYLPDETLMRFIVEETSAFFEGQTSATDAASALQLRATAYLNE